MKSGVGARSPFFPSLTSVRRGAKRDGSGLAALAEVAAGEAGAPAQPDKRAKGQTRKMHVPEWIVEAARVRFKQPNFGVQGASTAAVVWGGIGNLMEQPEHCVALDGADDVAALRARVTELEKQLEEARSESVAAIVERYGEENFGTHFGLSKKEFDWLFDLAKSDLSKIANVFSPKPVKGKSHMKPLGIDLEDVLGIICRHVLLNTPFERICKGFARADKHASKGKMRSPDWAGKIFDAVLRVLTSPESRFHKRLVRRQTPTEVWEYTRKHCPEVVAFLRKYVNDFSDDRTCYVVLVDGTHFIAKSPSDFYTMLLTHSRKKSRNTLLSICGSVPTKMFAYFTEPVGGKTSEKAACDGTSMYSTIVNFAAADGAIAVIVVDKGFGFMAMIAAAGRDQYVFIPHGAQSGKQLSEMKGCFNRDQARLRMPIEHHFGDFKRRIACLSAGSIQLGAFGKALHEAHAERLSRKVLLGFLLYNGFIMLADPSIVFDKRRAFQVSLSTRGKVAAMFLT